MTALIIIPISQMRKIRLRGKSPAKIIKQANSRKPGFETESM